MVTLNELRLGEQASILSVDGSDSVAVRLMEMGLYAGEKIMMLGSAPLGDPCEYMVCDCQISLRKKEAERVHIERI